MTLTVPAELGAPLAPVPEVAAFIPDGNVLASPPQAHNRSVPTKNICALDNRELIVC
jgi:hypothetical protein